MLVIDVPVASVEVQVDSVGESLNPRGPVKDTTDLQTSFAERGLLDPIVVRVKPGATNTAYLLIHGERRLTAARALGWKTIAARVRQESSTPDDDVLDMLAGDVHQEYPAFYLAKAFKRLVQNGRSMKEIAESWGRSADLVSAHIKLLDAHSSVQEAVMDGRMGMSAFARIKHVPQSEQEAIVEAAGETVSLRHVMAQMKRRADGAAVSPTEVITIDRSVKGYYQMALGALADVQQAIKAGKLPAAYDLWPPDVQYLHEELLAAVATIRPFPASANGTAPKTAVSPPAHLTF